MKTYKSFWQGSSWVLSVPSQIVQSIRIQNKDNLLLKVEDDKLILTNPPEDMQKFKKSRKIGENTYIVTLRVIGGEGVNGKYLYIQLGFTIPKDISEKFANTLFEVVLEEKTANSFKIAYIPVRTVNECKNRDVFKS